MKSPLLLYSTSSPPFICPTLSVSAPDKAGTPLPGLNPTPEQPATRRTRPLPCIQRDSCQTNRLKHPTPHSQAALFPTPCPGPGNSQPAIRPLRQFPTTPRPSVYKPHPKHAQAPTKPLSRPPSVRQSSECPAVFRAPGNPPNAPPPFPAKRSPASPLRHARPRNPEHRPASRNPQIPPDIPTPIPSPGIPKHKKNEAGIAPAPLQTIYRYLLDRTYLGLSQVRVLVHRRIADRPQQNVLLVLPADKTRHLVEATPRRIKSHQSLPSAQNSFSRSRRIAASTSCLVSVLG